MKIPPDFLIAKRFWMSCFAARLLPLWLFPILQPRGLSWMAIPSQTWVLTKDSIDIRWISYFSKLQNTLVMINLASVHLDKSHFVDPEAFRPERFIDAHGKFVKSEKLIPFGFGAWIWILSIRFAHVIPYPPRACFVFFFRKTSLSWWSPGENELFSILHCHDAKIPTGLGSRNWKPFQNPTSWIYSCSSTFQSYSHLANLIRNKHYNVTHFKKVF